jgi:SAM-dependent methyltransferase
MRVERPTWAPPDVALDHPSTARIYDYMLGGSHHVRADREIAEQLLAVAPEIGPTALANRHFMRRALQFLLDAGVRQFLDLGSGIPTVGNVHEIAQRAAPDARVVYVDIDPVAVAHSRAILAGDQSVLVLQADLREPATVLTDPGVVELLDFDRPIAVLLVAVLHFIPDSERPAEIIAQYRDALTPGSYLVISQASWPEEVTDERREVLAIYERTTSPVGLRNREEIAAFFTDFELVEPGLVPFVEWRPEPGGEPPPKLMPGVVGVGVKR